MNPLVVFLIVHGFNVRDQGRGSTDRLAAKLRADGHRVIELDYGWMGVVGTYLADKPMAAIMAPLTILLHELGVKLFYIGHSNGCAIGQLASIRKARFAGMFLINPALDRDATFGDATEFIRAFYTRSDAPTVLARILPKHPWGAMGHHGPARGSRAKGVDLDRLCGPGLGHSGVFQSPRALHSLAKHIMQVAGEASR